MTDDQVLKEAVSAKKQGLSETDIASRLLKKGATMAQIQKLRRQYASQITKQGLDSNVDNAISNVQDRIRTNRESNDNGIVTHEGEEAPQYVAPVEPETTTGKKVFGRDIFNNKALTFEPSALRRAQGPQAQGRQPWFDVGSTLRPFDRLRDRRGGGMFCSLRIARA